MKRALPIRALAAQTLATLRRGGASLTVRYQGPGVARQRIPLQRLFVTPDGR